MNTRNGHNGFTITELLVAMALLAGIIAASGVVFKEAVRAHRTAAALTEITRKARVITEQLERDFSGIMRDSVIAMMWTAEPVRDKFGVPVDKDGDGVPDHYERFDRIVFFSQGQFQTQQPVRYNDMGAVDGILYGSQARILYGLAKNADGLDAERIDAPKRVLARSQHIASDFLMLDPEDNSPIYFPYSGKDISGNYEFAPDQFYTDNLKYEFDTIRPQEWPFLVNDSSMSYMKDNIFNLLTDIYVGDSAVTVPPDFVRVAPDIPDTYHMFLEEGVGQFYVQGWYEPENRWIPDIDPDGDGDLSDSDYALETGHSPAIVDQNDGPGDEKRVIGMLYHYYRNASMAASDILAFLQIGRQSTITYPGADVTADTQAMQLYKVEPDTSNFNQIPGIGNALKFTFTLYDSKGVFPEGRTFSYIVYLN